MAEQALLHLPPIHQDFKVTKEMLDELSRVTTPQWPAENSGNKVISFRWFDFTRYPIELDNLYEFNGCWRL